MALGSHLITVRRLEKYINDVIGKKANLPDTSKTIIGNISQINSDLLDNIKKTTKNTEDIETIAGSQIPQSTVENAVNNYVSEHSGGFATEAELKEVIKKWNILETDVVIKEKTYVNAQGIESLNQDYFAVYFNATVNTIYYLYSGAFTHSSELYNHRPRIAVLFDNNDNVIQFSEYPNSIISYDSNINKIAVCFKYENPSQSKKSSGDYITEYSDMKHRLNSVIVTNDNIEDKSISSDKIIFKNNRYSVVEKRIATFNFQFDDGNVKDSQIVELFDSVGYKCGFGLLSTNNRMNEYIGYQEKGYEILSHSTDAVGMEDTSLTVDEVENKLKNSRKILESNGFNIRGWITPNSAMNNIYIPTLKKYYDYGATVYRYSSLITSNFQTKNDDTCKLYRNSLGVSGGIDSLKSIVDEAIENSGFVTFYGHSADLGTQFTSDTITQLLQYIKLKENDLQCVCLKPCDAVDYYFHVRHSDYLELRN